MQAIEELSDYAEIKEIADVYGTTRESLLPVLDEIQKRKGYIGLDEQQIVADIFGISPVEVYGVIHFYHFLHAKPTAKYAIKLCKNISCEMKEEKKEIKKIIERELGISVGASSENGKFSLEEISCIGQCDKAPAMLINEKPYCDLNKEKILKILSELRAEAI